MILIFAEELTPRIEYIFRVIFTQILKKEVSFTENSKEFQKSDLPKINYSFEKFADEFYIKPHRLTLSKGLFKPSIQSVWYEGSKYFCESSQDSDLPFDPFAASFYVLTRHEEYTETNRDKLKRYPYQNSILWKYKLLKKPVVNIWAGLLSEKLQEKYPKLHFSARQFSYISTIDIDNAFAYQYKGFWRTKAAGLRTFLKAESKEQKIRHNVLAGKEKDPYDTYDLLDSIFEGNREKVKFFFLLGDYGRFDKNISHTNVQYRQLIRQTAKKYDVGIHSSFASSRKGGKRKVCIEKQRLEEIIGKAVHKNRQHFIMLKFPRTYKRLFRAGITEDFTMGYSTQTGFRAGICSPYYYYDLKNDCATELLITPFQVMDGTLLHYLRLKPEEALDEVKQMMQEVKNVGGTFVSVWHNETVNDLGIWKGYRAVFEQMHKLGFEWANTVQKEEPEIAEKHA